MNTALIAGQLPTNYLNHIFAVGRGDYAELGILLISVAVENMAAARSVREPARDIRPGVGKSLAPHEQTEMPARCHGLLEHVRLRTD